MMASRTYRHLLALSVAVVFLGTLAITSPATAGAEMPLGEEPSDAFRVELEDLEEIVESVALNARAASALMVSGRPVLTDRGFIHVTAADFIPRSTSSGGFYDPLFWFRYGLVYGGNSNGCTYAWAPVFLPEGVTVSSMALTAIDDSTGTTLSLRLARSSAFADAVESMALIETDGDSPGLRLWVDGTVTNAVINNGLYQYYLQADCLMPAQKVRAAFIYYDD